MVTVVDIAGNSIVVIDSVGSSMKIKINKDFCFLLIQIEIN